MKTRPSRLLLSHCTTASVNVSQPLSLCELAWCALTVNTALSNNTPGEQSHKMAGLLMTSSSPDVSTFKLLLKKTLFGPSSQISVSRVLKAFNVRNQFFVHVLQTGHEKIKDVMNISLTDLKLENRWMSLK